MNSFIARGLGALVLFAVAPAHAAPIASSQIGYGIIGPASDVDAVTFPEGSPFLTVVPGPTAPPAEVIGLGDNDGFTDSADVGLAPDPLPFGRRRAETNTSTSSGANFANLPLQIGFIARYQITAGLGDDITGSNEAAASIQIAATRAGEVPQQLADQRVVATKADTQPAFDEIVRRFTVAPRDADFFDIVLTAGAGLGTANAGLPPLIPLAATTPGDGGVPPVPRPAPGWLLAAFLVGAAGWRRAVTRRAA